MSLSSEYNILLPEFQATKPENVVTPNMPVDVKTPLMNKLVNYFLQNQEHYKSSGSRKAEKRVGD